MKAQSLESISVRRAKVVDADKVRYRVYSTNAEFVAVIAESALMAVKVSGVKEPFRIVRDLPTDGIAVEAAKIAKAEATDQLIALTTKPKEQKSDFKAEMKPPQTVTSERFVPMKLRDMGPQKKYEGFAISHEALNQLLEAVRKPTPPAEEPKVAASAPEATAPISPPAAPTPPVDAAFDIVAEETSPTPAAAGTEVLSEDEVSKLLKE